MLYTILGKVIKGDSYGRKLGYPTANLETKDPVPPPGVYAGVAILGDKSYRAGILIKPIPKIEAHLIGFSGDLYGKILKLELNKFLRDPKKFDSEEELKAQIKEDLEQC